MKFILSLAASVVLVTSLGFQAPSQAVAAPLKPGHHQVRPVANKALDFTLVNKTGYDIAHVYLSPADKDTWGDNILEDSLPDGNSVDIEFHPEATATKWDLRIDWLMEDGADQEYVYWYDLKLDEINKLTLMYDKENDKTSAKIE